MTLHFWGSRVAIILIHRSPLGFDGWYGNWMHWNGSVVQHQDWLRRQVHVSSLCSGQARRLRWQSRVLIVVIYEVGRSVSEWGIKLKSVSGPWGPGGWLIVNVACVAVVERCSAAVALRRDWWRLVVPQIPMVIVVSRWGLKLIQGLRQTALAVSTWVWLRLLVLPWKVELRMRVTRDQDPDQDQGLHPVWQGWARAKQWVSDMDQGWTPTRRSKQKVIWSGQLRLVVPEGWLRTQWCPCW